MLEGRGGGWGLLTKIGMENDPCGMENDPCGLILNEILERENL